MAPGRPRGDPGPARRPTALSLSAAPYVPGASVPGASVPGASVPGAVVPGAVVQMPPALASSSGARRGPGASVPGAPAAVRAPAGAVVGIPAAGAGHGAVVFGRAPPLRPRVPSGTPGAFPGEFTSDFTSDFTSEFTGQGAAFAPAFAPIQFPSQSLSQFPGFAPSFAPGQTPGTADAADDDGIFAPLPSLARAVGTRAVGAGIERASSAPPAERLFSAAVARPARRDDDSDDGDGQARLPSDLNLDDLGDALPARASPRTAAPGAPPVYAPGAGWARVPCAGPDGARLRRAPSPGLADPDALFGGPPGASSAPSSPRGGDAAPIGGISSLPRALSARPFVPYGLVPAYPADAAGALLEEVRASRGRRLELADVAGHVVAFATDQHGSRFLQQRMDAAPAGEREALFAELLPAALRLMTDVFGNYVVQKFLEHGTPAQRAALARALAGHVLPLSLQMYGCRVVQKALEHVPGPEQAAIVAELDGHVLRCVKDQNGNHVIQKVIEVVPGAPFVVGAFRGQVFGLATHPYGCRVIQRIFEHGAPADVRPLLDELQRSVPALVQDQYGNYVVQHILEHGPAPDRAAVLGRVRGSVLAYSRHKFASNVVEKCVAHGAPADRAALIDEVLAPGADADDECALLAMMRDQYANYVVQRMLDVVDGAQRDRILARIRPHLAALRRFTYGKHILAKVEALLAAADAARSAPPSPRRRT